MCILLFQKEHEASTRIFICHSCGFPNSMTLERCFSTSNILFSKGRTSTSQSTLFERLIIYWNGIPTAKYDPRQAVSKFFCDKKRQESRPTVHIYKEREFISKFFLRVSLVKCDCPL